MEYLNTSVVWVCDICSYCIVFVIFQVNNRLIVFLLPCNEEEPVVDWRHPDRHRFGVAASAIRLYPGVSEAAFRLKEQFYSKRPKIDEIAMTNRWKFTSHFPIGLRRLLLREI